MKIYWTIKAQAEEETGEVLLYGDIGEGWFEEGNGAKAFAKELKALGKLKTLNIRINSGGGSLFEGLAIYNTLDRHPAHKNVFIDGIAASIASVIAMAGNQVIMPKNALMMVHDPIALVIGSAEEMRKMAVALDKMKKGLISAYMKKTKLGEDEISELMTDETWLNADEAIAMGFADKAAEPVAMAAKIDLSKFKNVPKALLEMSGLWPTDFRSRDEPALVPAKEPGGKILNVNNQQGGRIKMDKCKICGTVLVEGKCPTCEARAQARLDEMVRTKEILSIGEQFKMTAEASAAIIEGKTIEEFRATVMETLRSKIVPIDRVEPQPKDHRPFKGIGTAGLGDQLIAVYNAARPGGFIDPRLIALNVASGLGTQVPSEGGFVIQTDFSMVLMNRVTQVAVLVPKCWHVPIGPNADGVELPYIDETSRVTGSRWGGVQIYRRAEADTVLASKPKFGSLELRLEDQMGICYSTNRMLQDAPSAGAIIGRAFESEMAFISDDEIVRGTGTGEPLGILNAGCKVRVPKETGQPADTIVVENLIKMFSRMPARNRPRAEWYYNQEIELQLFTMGIIIGMGGAPIYMPPGGLSAAPYGTLLGRPMIPIEQASALGDEGDIMFVDLNEYMYIEKGGLDAQQSIHVRFLWDEMTFKFIMRNNGCPLWKSSLTPYKGANALSPFVTLQDRA